MPSPRVLLPTAIVPRSYLIELTADPSSPGFSGTVRIQCRVEKPTSEVVLHAVGLNLGPLHVRTARNTFQIEDAATEPLNETVAWKLPARLPKGEAELAVAFRGELNPSMHGLYLAKDGPHTALVTQCEATAARAIFPCFDQPDLKASIQWIVSTSPGLDVVANGPCIDQERESERVVHTFAPTRTMSTYLGALTIGSYDVSRVFNAGKAGRIPCRLLAPRGMGAKLDFARSVTKRVLPWYEEYFGLPYAFAKLDQVAVPGFEAGAMENVGAIFYRQSLLLADPKTTSWAAKKRIAEVVAHEIAHQWFGNLVTMKWWDDLWLNEAFATWIAFKSVDEWKPKWRMWDDYLLSKESALVSDSLVSTHPIYTKVATPAEATELFDLITYEKGCAVLRMAESFLGPKTFRQGIRRYMREHQGANARGADLWRALGESAKAPVGKVMQSWIGQPGFPLLSQRLEKGALVLSQQRFTADQSVRADTQSLWSIPVSVVCGIRGADGRTTRRTLKLLLEQKSARLTLPKGVRWAYANAESSGFYRVALDEASHALLRDDGALALTPGELTSWLCDTWALVQNGQSGRVAISRFFDVLESVRGKRDHMLQRAVYDRLLFVRRVLVPASDLPRFERFVSWLLAPQLLGLSWNGKLASDPKNLWRASLVACAGEVARHPQALVETEKLAERERDDAAHVEPALAQVAVRLSGIRCDALAAADLLRTYHRRKEQNLAPDVQARYLGALGAVEAPDAVRFVLDRCDDGSIPQEQLNNVLIPLLSNPLSQSLCWGFLRSHWQQVSTQVGGMGVSRLVEATGHLSPEHADDVQSFFEENPVASAHRAVGKALETMRIRAQLIANQRGPLQERLAADPA